MFLKVCVNALSDLHTDGWVEEIGCSNLYRRSPCEQELYCILSIANAPKTNHGHFNGMSHLVDHSQGNWLDARTAESSCPDTQDAFALFDVDGHSH